MAEVKLKDICVKFFRNEVLKNITFSANEGELCVLLGPSGCGKSLILRTIAGLTRPYKGLVYIGNKVVNNISPGNRDVSMVFQSYALYPNLTVRENFEFPLLAARMSKTDIKNRVKEVTNLLHMEELLGRYPLELSGGQQQRVATGRALVRRPRVFLLDEPLGSLDAKIRVETRGRLKRLQKDLGITTIYVTHDQAEAQAMGDKIIVIDKGIIEQIGSPEEIYENPKNSFVAEFMGYPRINFIDCKIKEIDNKFYFINTDFKFPLSDKLSKRIKDNKNRIDKFILGVRPERIFIGREESEKNYIPAKVILIENQSNEFLLDIELKSSFLRARVKREKLLFEPERNQEVFINFDKDNIYLFDKKTGLRIV